MLGPVVLEHAVDLLHFGDGDHIAQEDGHLQDRFEDDLAPPAQREQPVDAAHQNGRQHREQQDGKQSAQHGGNAQQDILGLFAQMVAHPFFKGGLLLFGVVVVAHAHLCGIHHVPVAHDEALHHRDGSPHEGDLRPDAVGWGRLDLCFNGAVRLAHRAADVLRAAHHDAFHQGLPTHARFETFLFWLIHPCLLSPHTAEPGG